MSLYLCAGLATDVIRLIASIVVFIFVIGATYLTTRFVGNFQKKSLKGTNFDTVETYRLSNNKYLQLIRIGKEYVVVAVCKDTVTTICKVNEEDLILGEETEHGQQIGLQFKPESFSEMFEKMKDSSSDDIEQQEEQNEDGR